MGIMEWLGITGACEKEPVALTDANFASEVTKSEVPVLVDVWSNGCQPCLALVPTIKRLACKYEGKLKVAQLNVGAAPKTVARLGVRGTPTVLFFEKGRVVERIVGMRGQHYYEEFIDNELIADGPSTGIVEEEPR